MARPLRYAAADFGPLSENARHKFAAQFALQLYDANAVYSLIPKNGCSTLRYALGRANGILSGPEHLDWIHENTHTFAADLRGLTTAAYSFVILRCPFRRLASAFLDKIVGRYPPFWRLFPQKDGAQNPNQITFRDTVAAICAPGGVRRDVHWRPQSDFLVYRDYDDWFRLEDFGTMQDTLDRKIGLDLADTRNMLGHDQSHHSAAPPGTYADTPLLELQNMRANGQVPDYRMLYDTECAGRVAKAYACDISLYAAQFGTSGLLFPNLVSKILAHQESSQ